MRTLKGSPFTNRKIFSLLAAAVVLPACGSGTESGPEPTKAGSVADTAFNPPAVLPGYTRIVAPTVRDVGPGSDVTFCQYVIAPVDHDTDVLDVMGYQSKFGHHAVAFATTASMPIGSSMPCMGEGMDVPSDAGSGGNGLASMGTFLGGVGGDAGGNAASALPPGVAFRLAQGSGIMFNIHFINTGEKPIDGNAVLDFKFADTDPNRKIAAMFLNLNFGFTLPPNQETDSSIECTAKSDVSLIMMSNHMHEYGIHAITSVTHSSGDVETLHEDPKWSFDMQFNPNYSRWTPDAPFVIHAGDVLRTSCSWMNDTSKTLSFPREMCIGVGFALADGSKPAVPVCVNGNWFAPQ